MSENEDIVHGLIDVPQQEVGLLMEAGYLSMEIGKNKEAQDIFTGVAALVPHNETPQVALGHLFFAQGRFQQALQHHQEAAKINDKSGLAKAHVGEALIFLKRYDEGIKALREAIELEPDGLAAEFAKALIDAYEDGAFQ